MGIASADSFYYIERGMGAKWKWLAKIFAFFGVCVGLFGIGTFSQVNGISSAIQNFFDPNKTNCVTLPFLGTYSWAVVIASLILAFWCWRNPDWRIKTNCDSQPDHRSVYGCDLFCI